MLEVAARMGRHGPPADSTQGLPASVNAAFQLPPRFPIIMSEVGITNQIHPIWRFCLTGIVLQLACLYELRGDDLVI
jgi:hypothetical protein